MSCFQSTQTSHIAKKETRYNAKDRFRTQKMFSKARWKENLAVCHAQGLFLKSLKRKDISGLLWGSIQNSLNSSVYICHRITILMLKGVGFYIMFMKHEILCLDTFWWSLGTSALGFTSAQSSCKGFSLHTKLFSGQKKTIVFSYVHHLSAVQKRLRERCESRP